MPSEIEVDSSDERLRTPLGCWLGTLAFCLLVSLFFVGAVPVIVAAVVAIATNASTFPADLWLLAFVLMTFLFIRHWRLKLVRSMADLKGEIRLDGPFLRHTIPAAQLRLDRLAEDRTVKRGVLRLSFESTFVSPRTIALAQTDAERIFVRLLAEYPWVTGVDHNGRTFAPRDPTERQQATDFLAADFRRRGTAWLLCGAGSTAVCLVAIGWLSFGSARSSAGFQDWRAVLGGLAMALAATLRGLYLLSRSRRPFDESFVDDESAETDGPINESMEYMDEFKL